MKIKALTPILLSTALLSAVSAFASDTPNTTSTINTTIKAHNTSQDTTVVHDRFDTDDRMAVFRRTARVLQLKPVNFHHRDLLEEHEQRTYTLHTTPNTTYYVAGVCDDDCADIDISIRDDDGSVAQDYKMDDVPVAKFVATKNSYQVRVDMEECKTKACFVQLEAFYK